MKKSIFSNTLNYLMYLLISVFSTPITAQYVFLAETHSTQGQAIALGGTVGDDWGVSFEGLYAGAFDWYKASVGPSRSFGLRDGFLQLHGGIAYQKYGKLSPNFLVVCKKGKLFLLTKGDWTDNGEWWHLGFLLYRITPALEFGLFSQTGSVEIGPRVEWQPFLKKDKKARFWLSVDRHKNWALGYRHLF
jgi:hypothetical protein